MGLCNKKQQVLRGGEIAMKKSMNQSTLTMILNGGSIFALVVLIILLFVYGSVSDQLDQANEDRFNLTYNANRFMKIRRMRIGLILHTTRTVL